MSGARIIETGKEGNPVRGWPLQWSDMLQDTQLTIAKALAEEDSGTLVDWNRDISEDRMSRYLGLAAAAMNVGMLNPMELLGALSNEQRLVLFGSFCRRRGSAQPCACGLDE